MSEPEKSNVPDYVIQVNDTLQNIHTKDWNDLLALQAVPTPFMRHEYLNAMQQSGCASEQTGWVARYFTVWLNHQLQAACAAYIKSNSYGEYVFDHAWANAYHQHGLPY
ncbi:MAG TPA: peptidogalycan biosysnthesis protein [Burkholderiaceae bacterium]|nr:peptidogalycan biosysnthesis protein [Burkholderiaceae bacterium]